MKKRNTRFSLQAAAAILSCALLPGMGLSAGWWADTPVCVTAQAASLTEDGVFSYEEKNGEITITGWNANGGTAEIPAEVNGRPVTRIGEKAFQDAAELIAVSVPEGVTVIGAYAFSGCSRLTSVSVPESVTTIGACAFEGCTRMTKAVLPETLTEVPEAAFYGCSALKTFSLPGSVKTIGPSAFYDCASLSDLTLPDALTDIGEWAFYGCRQMQTMTIPGSVQTIGNGAFVECFGLTSVTVSPGVEKVGEWAFQYCGNLTDVVLPDSLTAIGHHAFYACSSLPSAEIPSGVSEIGNYAFCWCTALTSVSIPPSVTKIGGNAFARCPSVTISGVPGSYAQTYAGEKNIPFSPLVFQNRSYLSKTSVPKLTMVTVTGACAYGTGNVTYAFYYKKSTSTAWTSLGKKFEDTKAVSFVPNMPAVYQIMVKAKDETGAIVVLKLSLNVTVPTSEDLVNKSVITKTAALKGESVGLTGKAVGGEGDYAYAFYYRKTTSRTFTPVAAPYSGKTKVFFKPAGAAEYVVRILVKDAAGTIAVKEYSLSVSKPE